MSATEAQAAAAIVVLERMIDAARNGNQAGEDAVVAAAAGPDLLACIVKVMALPDPSEIGDDPDRWDAEDAMSAGWASVRAAIANATGSPVPA